MTMVASEVGTRTFDLLKRGKGATALAEVVELLQGMPGGLSGLVIESGAEFSVGSADELNDALLGEIGNRQEHPEQRSVRLVVRVDRAIAAGEDVDSCDAVGLAGQGGSMLYTLGDLRQAFDGLRLEHVKVGLVTGGAFVSPVALLAALQRERNVSEFSDAVFGADPFGTLAAAGVLPRSITQALAMVADMAVWTNQHRPRSRAVRVSTRWYRKQGATPVQEIAFAVSTAQAYFRSMLDAGMRPADAARQFVFEISAGPDAKIAAAKVSVVRKYWLDTLTALGVAASEARLTVTLRPVGGPVNPGSEGVGSGSTAELSDRFTVTSAIALRQIEAQGGMGAALHSGWVRSQLKGGGGCGCGGGCCGKTARDSEEAELMSYAVQRIRDWRAAHPQARPALQKLREVIRTGLGSGEVTEYAVRAAVAGATVGQIAAALLATTDTIQINGLA